MKRLPASAIATLCVTLAAGCDFGFRDAGADAAWELDTLPADGEREAPRAARLVVLLDRPLLPQRVSPASVRVSSGALVLGARVRYQPVQREIWIDLDAPLDPETTFLLQLEGLADLDRNELPEPYVARFRTGLPLGEATADPPVDAAAVLDLLRERCASSRCHGGSSPALGLDLSSHAAIVRTAVGARSRFANGNVPGERVRSALSLAGLPIIDVVAGRGASATSLLVYKVLGDEHVPGEPMPPDTDPPLRSADLARIAAWIEAGAPAR